MAYYLFWLYSCIFSLLSLCLWTQPPTAGCQDNIGAVPLPRPGDSECCSVHHSEYGGMWGPGPPTASPVAELGVRRPLEVCRTLYQGMQVAESWATLYMSWIKFEPQTCYRWIHSKKDKSVYYSDISSTRFTPCRQTAQLTTQNFLLTAWRPWWRLPCQQTETIPRRCWSWRSTLPCCLWLLSTSPHPCPPSRLPRPQKRVSCLMLWIHLSCCLHSLMLTWGTVRHDSPSA